MEREYKWQIPQETLAALAETLHTAERRLSHETVQMSAVYYDTADDLVYRSGAALRIRRENGRSVCCMKRTVQKQGAQALREEYEVGAETLDEGLQRLPSVGAPRELCELLRGQTFRELARTEFTRNCYLLEICGAAPFTAEFAVDVGALGVSGHMLPFEELELELKSGDAAAFQDYADALEAQFSLVPQEKSKLARAVAAANAPHGKENTQMNHVNRAKELYEQGFYCSQAVLAAFADVLDLTEQQALQVGSCFGGGMCKGEVCGACTGALMALGMKYGRCVSGDWESQNRANALATEFLERFCVENGSYICNTLLGCDLSTAEGKAYARTQKLFSEFCPKMVESAASIAEQLMK